MSDLGSVSYQTAKAVTVSDSTPDPEGPFDGFYTGSGGNITVITVEGDTTEFAGTAAGIVIPCQIKQVKETGTAATGIVGMIGRMHP